MAEGGREGGREVCSDGGEKLFGFRSSKLRFGLLDCSRCNNKGCVGGKKTLRVVSSFYSGALCSSYQVGYCCFHVGYISIDSGRCVCCVQPKRVACTQRDQPTNYPSRLFYTGEIPTDSGVTDLRDKRKLK